MRIALDTSSLQLGHQYRGLGFYTQRLKTALAHQINILTFTIKPPSNIDLVHYPAFTLFTLPPKVHKPFIVTVHDLIPLKYPQHFPLGIRGKILWYLQKKWLKKAKAIITDSKASRQDIIKFTGINQEKIEVIYLAADKEFTTLNDQSRLKKTQNKYHLPEKFVLYVGDLNYNKNIPLLAQTCLDLNYPLVVVGKQALSNDFDKSHPETKDLTKFQQLAHDNPKKILRLGFVSTKDLVALYNLATIYAHPSLAEGFGLPILEAFACGCPVITSKFTSTQEIAGEAAHLINPTDSKDLQKTLRNLWGNTSLRQKLSQLGLKQVKKFSWEKTALKTIKVYEKILK